jgi:hypothetical protein
MIISDFKLNFCIYSHYTELLGILVDEVVKGRPHKYGEINIANFTEYNLHRECTVSPLVKKLPILYGTRIFITKFPTDHIL